MRDRALPPDPGAPSAVSCARCVDPVAIVLHEVAYRRISHEVLVFRCPDCGALILDDIVGFKGHGTVLRASEAEIDAYIKAPPGRPWPIVSRSAAPKA